MSTTSDFDAWNAAQSYEHYMGRWSRRIAARFVEWLDPAPKADWLEIGCGTGALTAAVIAACAPRSVLAIDPSAEFVAHARATIGDERARFEVADAASLPATSESIDIVTSALVLNFIPDRSSALVEMQRVLRPDGLLTFYVWDYPAGGVGFIDAFWKAAAEIDPAAAGLNERQRFPFCTHDGLVGLCRDSGLRDTVVEPIGIETEFAGFEAFWQPFTLGSGPAPGYCMSLPEERRALLKARLAEALGTRSPIRLVARAWAVRARRRQ